LFLVVLAVSLTVLLDFHLFSFFFVFFRFSLFSSFFSFSIAEVVEGEKRIVETEEAKAREEAAKCGVIQEEVMRIQSDAEADLKAAEPLVVQAMAALGTCCTGCTGCTRCVPRQQYEHACSFHFEC
jgi:hypothetical protein